jgi:16S rRNA (cytosine1402-N4)-methyltransferase
MHEPVLLNEVLDRLALRPGAVCVDATAGSGGHAVAMLNRIRPGGRLLGIDRDVEAIERTRARLAGEKGAVWTLAQGNHAAVAEIARKEGFSVADAVLIDCGVSLEQLMTAERGFSFQNKGPLDMRMDRSQSHTAADLVNGLTEAELATILFELGDEPAARRIARAIAEERAVAPFGDTVRLATLIERVLGGRRGRIHPATKTFQALRMAVNGELESLAQALRGALDLLTVGGRLAVISFHSGEDRLVKRFFTEHVGRWESLPAGGEAWRGSEPRVRWVTRKPVIPSSEEAARNPRARSSKLRVVERIESEERR